METNRVHRRCLIDPVQLVVRDHRVSEDFYTTVMAVLNIPVLSTDNGYFMQGRFLSFVRSIP